jgi:hypothetical protein
MIVPAAAKQNPTLLGSYPTGAHPFEPTNAFTFSVGPASGSAISASGIHLTINGADVTSRLTLTPGTNGSFTGTIPIALNAQYTAVLNLTNTTSLSSSYSFSFDTFSQTNFMFEAEDFDFNGGQFIDNPVPTADNLLSTTSPTYALGTEETNSYYGNPGGLSGNLAVFDVDFNTDASVNSADFYYRPFDNCGTEITSDYLRQKFINSQTNLSDPNVADFDVGWWNANWWLNYTRTYPTGNYYLYGRLAGGNGAFSGTTVSQVTAGWGTTNQTLKLLGTLGDPAASGWQTWHWIPMLGTNGQTAVISIGGTNTLQVNGGGNLNANFYMLVPAAIPSAPPTVTAVANPSGFTVQFGTQLGHSYTVQYKNNLTDSSWSVLSTIAGDGTVKSAADTAGGGLTHRFYRIQVQ